MEKVTDGVTERVTERVTDGGTDRATDDVTKKVTDDVTERVADDVTKKVTDDVIENIKDDVTKMVPDKVMNTNGTKDITKNVTEPPSLAPSSDSPPTAAEPSEIHDNAGTLSQRTPKENSQDQPQPGHLDVTKDKPTSKEAWQTHATKNVEDKEDERLQSSKDKGTVDVKQVKEDLKVEDIEDEQQEIMEYVAVLEEEEKEGKEEEERYL